MEASEAKLAFTLRLLALASAAILATAACAPQAATPTAAPPKPAPTTAPAPPAPTAAPAKAEAPAAKPAPTAAPAAKPTEKPAAKPAGFDEKAVADFYKGKTVRLLVGYGPGGSSDIMARLLQKVYSKYIPGNPVVVVENKPGGGSMLVANTVYNSEPKDGTVIAGFSADLVLQQALGEQGVQFDSAKYNWLGGSVTTASACGVRTDLGIGGMQELVDGGKEITIASYGKGTPSYNPPAVMNVALGTRFKIITGYESGAATQLAVKNKEVQGWCTSVDVMSGQARDMIEGSNAIAKPLIVSGAEPDNHALFKGVPAAETLAKTDEARALLRAIHVPFQLQLPHAVAPEVPKDRLEALRRARDKAYKDPELLDGAQKAAIEVGPKTGEEAQQIVQGMLSTPPAVLAKLKVALQ